MNNVIGCQSECCEVKNDCYRYAKASTDLRLIGNKGKCIAFLSLSEGEYIEAVIAAEDKMFREIFDNLI